jgi:anti-sigma factor RsiW
MDGVLTNSAGMTLYTFGPPRVLYWTDGPLGYALAGDLPKDDLQTIARLVYRQFNP